MTDVSVAERAQLNSRARHRGSYSSHTLPLRALGLALLASALARPAHAEAQRTASEAERLFNDGLAEMKAGNYASGCPKLAESYALEPLPGALFTLAECEGSWKKPATALAHYQSFVDALTAMEPERRTTFEERRSIALAQIAALSASAPELTLDVAPDSLQELVVKVDGVSVDPTAYGVGRKVDPGEYALSAERDGKEVWQRRVRIAERERAHIEVHAPAAHEVTLKASPPALDRQTNPTRTAAYVAAGVSALGLTTGLVAGGIALGKKSSIDSNCPALSCNPDGRRALDSARTSAGISTLGFAAGGVSAALASVLWLVSPPRNKERNASTSRLRAAVHSNLRGGKFTLEGEF